MEANEQPKPELPAHASAAAALETYLLSAPLDGVQILKVDTYHKGQQRFVLRGDIVVQTKPDHGLDEYGLDGLQAIKNEVAGYIVARDLGWADLVPATALRFNVPAVNPSPAPEATCCVQVVLSDVAEALGANFLDEDVWRAAVFDYLIWQPDRKGRNWLATGHTHHAHRRLKLIDNSFGFNFDSRPVRSTFFDQKAGMTLPQPMIDGVRRLVESLDGNGLDELLSADSMRQLVERAELLLEQRRLPFASELSVTGAT